MDEFTKLAYRKHDIPATYLQKWQETVNLMAQLFDVPAGLIMRVLPEKIEVLISSRTDNNPYEQYASEHLLSGLYCETVMAERDKLHVPNALEDEAWENNPDVELDMISYLGVPLVWPDHSMFGTICVLDRETRIYSPVYEQLLWQFKESIEADFALHVQGKELRRHRDHLEELVAERTVALRNEIAERRRTQEQLEVSIEEKELLLREIHHRVKNNMLIISSLLRKQAEKSDDEQVRIAFRDSRNRIQALSKVHERLYHSSDLANINGRDYIRGLTSSILQSYAVNPEWVVLHINVEDVSITVDSALSCGLIINELLSNTLKHAFPDHRKGNAWVNLCRDEDDFILLTIGDDGIGLPAGFDFRQSEAMGLPLVLNLAERQLDGSIALKDGSSTEFVVRFQDIAYQKRI